MGQIIPFKTDKGEFLAVEVQLDHFDFEIKKSIFLYPGWSILTYKSPILWHEYQKELWIWESRSESGLTIIATSTAITEEQAAEIVDTVGYDTGFYKNYIDDVMWYCGALGSFKSLMQSIGCDMSKRYVILKQQ